MRQLFKSLMCLFFLSGTAFAEGSLTLSNAGGALGTAGGSGSSSSISATWDGGTVTGAITAPSPLTLTGGSGGSVSTTGSSMVLGVNGSSYTFTAGGITAPNGYFMSRGTETLGVTIATTTAGGINGKTFSLKPLSLTKQCTITQIDAVSLPTGTTIQFQLDERTLAGIGSAGTSVFTDANATATSPGVSYISSAFTNATMAAGAWLNIVFPATSVFGSGQSLSLAISYKQDE